jgi:tetratricopeptide (TPR) repeat protein
MSKAAPPNQTKRDPDAKQSSLPFEFWGKTGALGLLLFGLAFAVFFPVVHHDYVNMDDPSYVSDVHVQAGLTRAGVTWAFTTWHPLTWMSHMLDVQLFGTSAGGPHLVNLLLHSANAFLVFALLRRLTGALWPSVFVAALFALHPQQVETVAWVSERKGVLSTFFGLLTLLAYARFAQRAERSGQKSEGGNRTSILPPLSSAAYWLALFCFALGLMCKPMVVTLPCLMLLLDYWPLRRMQFPRLKFLLAEKIPFVVLAVLSALLTAGFQRNAGTLQTLSTHPVEKRIADAFMAYAHYLGKTFWPVDLAVPYPRNSHWPLGEVIGAGLLVAGLCAVAFRYGRRFPFLATGWFWFLGMLVPVLGLIQIAAQTVADRYQYLPSVGLFILVTWGAVEITKRWRVPKLFLGGLATLILIAATVRTRDQLRHWQNSETLALHAIAAVPGNWLAQYCLGWHYDTQGRKAEAIEHYRLAVQIKPNYAEPWNGLGCLYADGKSFTEALPCFEAAVRAKPENVDYRYNLAKALGALRRVPEACAQHEEALRLKPDFVLAHNDLGLALAYLGKFDEAIPHLRTAVRLKPNDPVLLLDLGKTLATAGQPAAAIEPFQEALRLAPENPQTHYVLGSALVLSGRVDEAIAQFQQVLRLKPDHAATHFALGKAYATQSQTNAAIQEFQETLRLQPASAQAKQALRSLGVTVSE